MRIGFIVFALFSQDCKIFVREYWALQSVILRIKASGFHPLSLCVFVLGVLPMTYDSYFHSKKLMKRDALLFLIPFSLVVLYLILFVVLQIDLSDFAPSEWNGYFAMWVMNAYIPIGLVCIINYTCRIVMLISFVRSVQTKIIFKVLWSLFILFLTQHFFIVRVIMFCIRSKKTAPETES